jgi:hypothetical protein
MIFVTSEPNLRKAIENCFDKGCIEAIMPEIWAATHHRTVEEITAIIASVRADRATRLAPNAVPEPMAGEGK